jgi:carbonic anhydrase
LGLLLCASATSWAADAPAEKTPSIGKITLPAKPEPQDPGSKESMAQQVRELVEKANATNQASQGKKGKAGKPQPASKVTLTIEAEPKKANARGTPAAPPDIAAAYAKAHGAIPNPVDSRAAAMAQVAGMGQRATGTAVSRDSLGMARSEEARWAYDGEFGPQAWGKLKPEYGQCATGMRQSPIHIQDGNTLQGPAEPLQFHYLPSSAMVVNTGRTIQVDVVGDNTLTVRGSTYKLTNIQFHHPSEERINDRAYTMAAHLIHRNIDGQLAIVAVLMDPGQANTLVNKVWTYMPLDVGDRVRMPTGLLDLNELLPQDQRYYQFIGSLTAPPCAENVLWMVLKQPVQISPEQLRLFAQLYPRNNRPVQPLNGRVVREGM